MTDAGDTLTVLVAEDSRSARMKIVSCLELLGVNVVEADDGVSAFEVLTEKQQEVDLVLTDLQMIQMNGDELCRKIRETPEYKELPVIVLSSVSEEKVTVKLFENGATDYLYKPFTQEEIVARINSHLEQVRLRKSLQEKISELKESNKIKDDLLSVCSHDLRSPLQVIMTTAELMLLGNRLSEKEVNMIGRIRNACDQLNDIADQIVTVRDDIKNQQ